MQQVDLAGQIVVVAGASSGIGRATALTAGRAGARVVVAARNRGALEEVRTAIVRDGGDAVAIPTDVADYVAVGQLMAQAVAAYGRIDAVINSVGMNLRQRALSELTAASWSEMLANNLTTAFNLTQAVVPIFRNQGGGLLIYISSIAARRADRSGIAYQATKAGVAALAHGTMEEERANGVRTSVIYPGLTDTPLVLQRPVPPSPDDLARALRPEDVAAACLFVMTLPARVHVPELVLTPTRA